MSPIRYGKSKYKFSELVKRIMREKGWTRERAARYVGGIEKRQSVKQKGSDAAI